jgi:hypothetical protein
LPKIVPAVEKNIEKIRNIALFIVPKRRWVGKKEKSLLLFLNPVKSAKKHLKHPHPKVTNFVALLNVAVFVGRKLGKKYVPIAKKNFSQEKTLLYIALENVEVLIEFNILLKKLNLLIL